MFRAAPQSIGPLEIQLLCDFVHFLFLLCFDSDDPGFMLLLLGLYLLLRADNESSWEKQRESSFQ